MNHEKLTNKLELQRKTSGCQYTRYSKLDGPLDESGEPKKT